MPLAMQVWAAWVWLKMVPFCCTQGEAGFGFLFNHHGTNDAATKSVFGRGQWQVPSSSVRANYLDGTN